MIFFGTFYAQYQGRKERVVERKRRGGGGVILRSSYSNGKIQENWDRFFASVSDLVCGENPVKRNNSNRCNFCSQMLFYNIRNTTDRLVNVKN